MKSEHSDRLAAKDWPELAALCRLLRLPWQEKVTRDDLLRRLGEALCACADEAVDRLMEDFWSQSDYAYRWRTIQVLGIVNTPKSREVLFQVAMRTKADELPWIRGAARQYVAALGDKSEVRKLLAANDTEVLQQAAVGLRGVAIDKDMIGRLVELMGSPDHHLRRLVAAVLGDDPGGQFAPEKVAAIVGAMPDVAHMEKADAVAEMGSWTNSEAYYRTYINALARMKDARQAIAQQLAGAPPASRAALPGAGAGLRRRRRRSAGVAKNADGRERGVVPGMGGRGPGQRRRRGRPAPAARRGRKGLHAT